MKYDIPHFVRGVLDRLLSNGYEAYIVGGCIRDMLMNRKPKDWDIATSALPKQVAKVFDDKRVINTGEKFGTVTIVDKEGKVEVTTFRSEGKYSDGRHPDWVSFGNNIVDDLSRRDFTINSMAWNHLKGMIDPFDGSKDIEKKIIRAVGDPLKRLSEDGLRMLRAIRFASNLDFTIEEHTLKAIKSLSGTIESISVERVRDEFFKTIGGNNPAYGMNLLLETELMSYLLPEMLMTVGFLQNNPYHSMDVYQHVLCVMENTPSSIDIRLAALFHDMGKPYCYTKDDEGVGHFYGHTEKSLEIAYKTLKRLKSSNDTINKVLLLVKNHMRHYKQDERIKIKRLIREVGKGNIFDLISLQKADAMCKSNPNLADNVLDMECVIKDILHKKEPLMIKDLAIDGYDLKKIGIEPGERMGQILNELLEIVIDEPELNSEERLLEIVKTKYSNNYS